MASLFLGEFFGFRAGRRLVLLGAGSFLAVAGNLIRATLLVRLANDRGAATLLEYHDRVGYAETGGIFLALVLAAWCMSWRSAGRLTESAGSVLSVTEEAPHRPRQSVFPGIWAGTRS